MKVTTTTNCAASFNRSAGDIEFATRNNSCTTIAQPFSQISLPGNDLRNLESPTLKDNNRFKMWISL